MNFEDLIETLSKGSATAVTTLESHVAELEALKAYLYVQTPVEQALRAEIDQHLKIPRVIFVCGSSGDGKSELFRRIHGPYLNASSHLKGIQLSTIQKTQADRSFPKKCPPNTMEEFGHPCNALSDIFIIVAGTVNP